VWVFAIPWSSGVGSASTVSDVDHSMNEPTRLDIMRLRLGCVVLPPQTCGCNVLPYISN
jgi:hypothetical protein